MFRILVTFIAPVIVMLMYLMHKGYRTDQVRDFISSFRRHSTFLSITKASSSYSGMFPARLQGAHGIMELAQLNDMFWVRLSQVIAAIVGY